MVASSGHITLHVLLLLIFGCCLMFGFIIAKKLHGGRFTAILPSFIGAIAVLFSIQVLALILEFVPIEANAAIIAKFSIQALHLVAGILFIQAVYQLYQLGFATSGFFGGK